MALIITAQDLAQKIRSQVVKEMFNLQSFGPGPTGFKFETEFAYLNKKIAEISFFCQALSPYDSFEFKVLKSGSIFFSITKSNNFEGDFEFFLEEDEDGCDLIFNQSEEKNKFKTWYGKTDEVLEALLKFLHENNNGISRSAAA